MQQFGLLLSVSGRKEDAFCRNGVAYAQHGFHHSLGCIVADAADLAGGGHVHTQDRICLEEP